MSQFKQHDLLKALEHGLKEAKILVVTREGGWLGLEDSKKLLPTGYAHTKSKNKAKLSSSDLLRGYDAKFLLIQAQDGNCMDSQK